VIKLADLGAEFDVTPRLTIERVDAPVEREGGVIVADVDELLDKLRNEAKVFWLNANIRNTDYLKVKLRFRFYLTL